MWWPSGPPSSGSLSSVSVGLAPAAKPSVVTSVAEAAEVMANIAIPIASLKARLGFMFFSPPPLLGCAFVLPAKSAYGCI